MLSAGALTIATTGVILASSGGGASWCNPNDVPKIEILPRTHEIHYDYTKSEAELSQFHIDTKNPYGGDVITDVGGLMQGGIKALSSMQIGTLTHSGKGETCMWYKNIKFEIWISPTIYINKKYPKGGCEAKAILGHEHKHVNVDRRVVNKYSELIGQALMKEIKRRYLYGPVPTANERELQARMEEHIKSIIDRYTAQMNQERMERQQGVDSLEEYQRVNRIIDYDCKNTGKSQSRYRR